MSLSRTSSDRTTAGQPRQSSFAIDRRELLAYAAAFGPAFLAAQGLAAEGAASAKPAVKRHYEMRTSINLWAFPYPQSMSLVDCFRLAKEAGFDAVEVNYNLEGDICPEVSEADLRKVGQTARDIGIEISGLCSFLFWPYSLTSEDVERRTKGRDLAKRMIHAAAALGT